jgi:hypothetical protein
MLGRDEPIFGRPNSPEPGRLPKLGRRAALVGEGLELGRLPNPPSRAPVFDGRGAAARATLVVRVGLTGGRLTTLGRERGTVPVTTGPLPTRLTVGAWVGRARVTDGARVGGTRLTLGPRVGGARFTVGARVGGTRLTLGPRVGARPTVGARVGARLTVGARVGARPTVVVRLGARFTVVVRP